MVSREDIINATFTLFSESGYSTTMREIASKVDIKTQSLYSHFSSKEDIIFTTIDREINDYIRFLNGMFDSIEHEPIDVKLKSLFFANIEFLGNEKLQFYRNVALINNIEFRNKCQSRMAAVNEVHNLKVKEYFEKGVINGEIDGSNLNGIIKLFSAMQQGILDIKLLYKGDFKQYANEVWEAYWYSISK